MNVFSRGFLLTSLLAIGAVSHAQPPPVASAADAFGPLRTEQNVPTPAPRPQPDDRTLNWVLHWNQVAIDASGLDHTPPATGEIRVFGEKLGPGRASRAVAIVHIAVFDAMNSIVGGYRGYTSLARTRRDASVKAAIAQSAHDTLVALFPAQQAIFDEELRLALKRLPRDAATVAGTSTGAQAARLVLRKQADDGSAHTEPLMNQDFVPSQKAGWWRQDPISLVPVALGAKWGQVRPFVLRSPRQFRVPPPPPMTSDEYAIAYDEAKRLGGDGVTTPTERTEEQTFIGIYWAYDGTPSLCAPPRLYNQIVQTVAKQMGTGAMETARLLALANVAMSDSGIAIWESKFHYQFWRPITAIRESDPDTGPSGSGDGNPNTTGDPTFMPLGGLRLRARLSAGFQIRLK